MKRCAFQVGSCAFQVGNAESAEVQVASRDAFRAGILLCVGLALAGAGVAAVGLPGRESRAEQADPSFPT